MKRRLNILCLVVMLVLSYSVLEQGYYIFLGAKMGAQTGLELGKKGSVIAAYKELMNLKVVNLIPSSMESFDFFRDSVYNEKMYVGCVDWEWHWLSASAVPLRHHILIL